MYSREDKKNDRPPVVTRPTNVLIKYTPDSFWLGRLYQLRKSNELECLSAFNLYPPETQIDVIFILIKLFHTISI